ncbi:DUF6694 family lipoprotein [Budvicia aquatica]|uniref:DUF4296 domain-containing protein n=1 Tax=Budvicia aquatica TaxID=82979 RepID=A0A2C6DHX8_9GAMM|nr:DUF6694 family lipoprotein [Budvicia aquatica]PHI30806.1 hypothetical protein CRN84_16400 [Budvicia aquatica]
MKRLIFVLILGFSLVGCAQNKIDTSGKDAYLKSINTMSESMPEEKKHEFMRAIEHIQYTTLISTVISNIPLPESSNEKMYDVAQNAYFLGDEDTYRKVMNKYIYDDPLYMAELKKSLGGKTADEIIGVKKK